MNIVLSLQDKQIHWKGDKISSFQYTQRIGLIIKLWGYPILLSKLAVTDTWYPKGLASSINTVWYYNLLTEGDTITCFFLLHYYFNCVVPRKHQHILLDCIILYA